MTDSQQSTRQRVPLKMYRTDGRLTIAAPMPGIEPENIIVEVTATNTLILRGSLRGEFKGMKDVLLDEWQAGDYERQLDLPEPVDATGANVTYGNGVLVVALPLTGATRPARLTVALVGPAHGARVGNAGHPVRRADGTAEEHVPTA